MMSGRLNRYFSAEFSAALAPLIPLNSSDSFEVRLTRRGLIRAERGQKDVAFDLRLDGSESVISADLILEKHLKRPESARLRYLLNEATKATEEEPHFLDRLRLAD